MLRPRRASVRDKHLTRTSFTGRNVKPPLVEQFVGASRAGPISFAARLQARALDTSSRLPILDERAYILRRPTVGHDFRDRRDGPARRHATPAGTEAGGTNLHDTKQGRQPPVPEVLERALCTTMITATAAAAMLLCLCLDQAALQPGQGHFPFRN